MDAIRLESLTKQYGGRTVVDHLQLCVAEGELVSLLGVNGSGKTTVIRMLSTLTPPTSGDAFLFGKSIVGEAERVKSMIGVSPQENAVAPGLSVLENLELMCGVYGLSKEERRERICTLCAWFDLTDMLSVRAGKLSGGWQRRLSIAMALVGKPKILFLDEPTLGLDVLARSELWTLIRRLKQTTTVLLTTHYLEEAEMLSDRVAILQNGTLLMCDTVERMKQIAGADNFEQAFIRIVKGEKDENAGTGTEKP